MKIVLVLSLILTLVFGQPSRVNAADFDPEAAVELIISQSTTSEHAKVYTACAKSLLGAITTDKLSESESRNVAAFVVEVFLTPSADGKYVDRAAQASLDDLHKQFGPLPQVWVDRLKLILPEDLDRSPAQIRAVVRDHASELKDYLHQKFEQLPIVLLDEELTFEILSGRKGDLPARYESEQLPLLAQPVEVRETAVRAGIVRAVDDELDTLAVDLQGRASSILFLHQYLSVVSQAKEKMLLQAEHALTAASSEKVLVFRGKSTILEVLRSALEAELPVATEKDRDAEIKQQFAQTKARFVSVDSKFYPLHCGKGIPDAILTGSSFGITAGTLPAGETPQPIPPALAKDMPQLLELLIAGLPRDDSVEDNSIIADLSADFCKKLAEKVCSLQEFGGSHLPADCPLNSSEAQLLGFIRRAYKEDPLFTKLDIPLESRIEGYVGFIRGDLVNLLPALESAYKTMDKKPYLAAAKIRNSALLQAYQALPLEHRHQAIIFHRAMALLSFFSRDPFFPIDNRGRVAGVLGSSLAGFANHQDWFSAKPMNLIPPAQADALQQAEYSYFKAIITKHPVFQKLDNVLSREDMLALDKQFSNSGPDEEVAAAKMALLQALSDASK